jgi:deazaflavin-dependent oxidoreductase (nitroreductase family)
MVVHRGRRSGRRYRTPVLAFRVDDGYVVALFYGADRDWVRNVLAAGGCTLSGAGAGSS